MFQAKHQEHTKFKVDIDENDGIPYWDVNCRFAYQDRLLEGARESTLYI